MATTAPPITKNAEGTSMTTAPPLIKNGVDVRALVNTVKAIDNTPALGDFQFRSSTQWKKGAQVETIFEGNTHNGVDDIRTTPLKWRGDEPIGLLGTGLYQSPADSLLHAASHCLTVTTVYHGAAKNVEIEKMKVSASGSLDFQGFLDLNSKKRPGFKHIHLHVNIDSPNSSEEVNNQTVRRAVLMEFEFNIEDDGSPAYEDTDKDRHGVSIDDHTETIDQICADPSMAQATFYTTTEWQGGAVVETTAEKFEMPPGNIQVRDEPLVLVTDEPPALLGKDIGPGPSETILHGIANCISVVHSYFAAAKGMRPKKFQIDFDGDMDLQGFSDTNDYVSPGYSKIRVKVDATSGTGGDKSKDELKAFYESLPSRSPICDCVRNPVHITFGLTHNGKVVSGPPMGA